MQRDTLDAIVSRLQPGGTFYLATDIHAYAEMSHELLAATPGLDNLLPDAWAPRVPERVSTKYEATARREGRACYYFAYRAQRAARAGRASDQGCPKCRTLFSTSSAVA